MKVRIIFLLLGVTIFSCKPKEQKNLPHFQTSVKGDSLILSFEQDVFQYIVPEGDLGSYFVSPDSQMIAVNSSPFSNLAISKVYKRSSNGYFEISKPKNLSTQVWENLESKYQVTKEEILSPRSTVLEWGAESSTIKVLATGRLSDGNSIREEITLKLK